LSGNADDSMTYGEFVQRRASIQAKIRTAERAHKVATDYRYTPLTVDGGIIAQRAIDQAIEELRQLVATWQDIQRNRGVKP
jgi:hypothetical protein